MSKKNFNKVADLLKFYDELSAPLQYINATQCHHIQTDVRVCQLNKCEFGTYQTPYSYYLSAYEHYPHVLVIYDGKRKFIGTYRIVRNGNAHIII